MNKINWTQVEVQTITSLDSGEPPVVDASCCEDYRPGISAYPFGAITVTGSPR